MAYLSNDVLGLFGFEKTANGGGCHIMRRAYASGAAVWISADDCGDMPQPDGWQITVFDNDSDMSAAQHLETWTSAEGADMADALIAACALASQI